VSRTRAWISRSAGAPGQVQSSDHARSVTRSLPARGAGVVTLTATQAYRPGVVTATEEVDLTASPVRAVLVTAELAR
ncbi:MAG TPA: hypothetical protein VKJ47_09035, partial [Candidatus Binatia bacterium]|nr:hypothetical protein [Candidatus Binatia bacterium]